MMEILWIVEWVDVGLRSEEDGRGGEVQNVWMIVLHLEGV